MLEFTAPRTGPTATKLDAWLARRVLAGLHPRAIATASGGEVSVRTAYRWARELVGLEDVQVGQYTATFILRRGRAPTQLGGWKCTEGEPLPVRAMAGTRCGRWMPIAREQCARFRGHRSQCNSRAHLDAAARVERERRAKARRALQRGMAA